MAQAAAQWAKPNGTQSSNPAFGGQLRQEAEAYFGQAWEHCAAFPAEADVNSLKVLIGYAMYLAEHAPDRDGEFNHLSAQALELLRKGTNPKAAQGEWFELLADREHDDPPAAALYAFGVHAGLPWAQLWIKGLGTAALAGLPDIVQAIRQRLSVATTVEFLAWSRGAYQRERHRRSLRPHVLRRWEEGFRVCEAFWGTDPRVRSGVRSAVEGRRRRGR
jgi:hypothetical protein